MMNLPASSFFCKPIVVIGVIGVVVTIVYFRDTVFPKEKDPWWEQNGQILQGYREIDILKHFC